MLRIVSMGIRIGIVRKKTGLKHRCQRVQQRRSSKAVRQLNQFRRKHFQGHHQPVVPVDLHIKVRDDVVVRHPALSEVMVLVCDLLEGVGKVEREVLLLRVEHQRQFVAALDKMHQFLVLPVILRLVRHLALLHLYVRLPQFISQHLKRLRQILLVKHAPRRCRHHQQSGKRQDDPLEYSHVFGYN